METLDSGPLAWQVLEVSKPVGTKRARVTKQVSLASMVKRFKEHRRFKEDFKSSATDGISYSIRMVLLLPLYNEVPS
jgi:hypothetical protein